MEASDNWVQFALDRKVISEPGTQFVYEGTHAEGFTVEGKLKG